MITMYKVQISEDAISWPAFLVVWMQACPLLGTPLLMLSSTDCGFCSWFYPPTSHTTTGFDICSQSLYDWAFYQVAFSVHIL